MCRTVLIFNAHCEHEHAEMQKCPERIASEVKWQRRSFLHKIFGSFPICRTPQETRNYTKAQVCPKCSSRGITYEKIRKDIDAAMRRPPRPIYRTQTDLDIGNPGFPPNLQRRNAVRQPADRRPQGGERSNTVQFQGEAPRLPNVRASAIFRESENPQPETLRRYLGSSGVPFEDHETPASRAPSISSSTSRSHRPWGRSNSHRHPPSTPHPLDNGSTSQYLDRPLPPLPLQPHRASLNSTPPSRPPQAPSRFFSQRDPRSYSDRRRGFIRPLVEVVVVEHTVVPSSDWEQDSSSSSQRQRPPQPPSRQPDSRRSSSQHPSQSPGNELALATYMPPDSSQAPSYHLGMPTDRELNRMSMEIESVESAWINAGRRSSQQQPVERQSMGSLTAPRRHRSQREGKYA